MHPLSVILCTHNPRERFMQRTLDGLRAQTLDPAAWDLLIVDNKSADPVAGRFDLSWHPNARVVVEEQLGLTPARLRGIAETRGDPIVMVDDDNVLAPNYLEEARRIGEACPFLGAWGGSTVGDFETQPEPWMREYLIIIGVREIERDTWSNVPEQYDATPIGAGMVIRRRVAERYAQNVLGSAQRSKLDRCGQSLMGGGDIDMACTSMEFGLGKGVFRSLSLAHIIPKERLRLEYLLKLREDGMYSDVIMKHSRGDNLPALEPKLPYKRRLIERYINRKIPLEKKLMDQAFYRGVRRGYEAVGLPTS